MASKRDENSSFLVEEEEEEEEQKGRGAGYIATSR